jgi:hypothetical protein
MASDVPLGQHYWSSAYTGRGEYLVDITDYADHQRLNWLPVDLAGKAISEIVTSYSDPSRSAPSATVYHVLNAFAAPWSAVLEGLSQGGIDFKATERRDWLQKLAASDDDVQRNPTYKLLVSDI